MDSRTQHGYLLRADLSGFTPQRQRAGARAGRARGLIGLIVGRLTPGLQLEVEGDAVYVYAPESTLPSGETFLRLIDDTYVAFRDRVDAIQRHSTCPCNTCRSVLLLDLKFVAHFGEYVLQDVAGSRKPLGSDVNLVHRLLKNSIGEATGWRAYALLTQPAAERLAIPTEGMHVEVQSYASLPPTRTFSFDLHARYETLTATRHVVVPPEQSDLRYIFELPVPPAEAWQRLNDPMKRTRWEGLPVQPARSAAGRKGVGTATHCMHGSKVRLIQTILDWHPFDYFTYESRNLISKRPDSVSTVVLQPCPAGTTVDFRIHVDLQPRLIGVLLYRLMAGPEYRRAIAKLRELASSPPDQPGSPHPAVAAGLSPPLAHQPAPHATRCTFACASPLGVRSSRPGYHLLWPYPRCTPQSHWPTPRRSDSDTAPWMGSARGMTRLRFAHPLGSSSDASVGVATATSAARSRDHLG